MCAMCKRVYTRAQAVPSRDPNPSTACQMGKNCLTKREGTQPRGPLGGLYAQRVSW